MTTPHVKYAVVHRPNDIGIDLPPGASAAKLAPDDYHLLEMDDGSHDEEQLSRRGWLDWLVPRHPKHGA